MRAVRLCGACSAPEAAGGMKVAVRERRPPQPRSTPPWPRRSCSISSPFTESSTQRTSPSANRPMISRRGTPPMRAPRASGASRAPRPPPAAAPSPPRPTGSRARAPPLRVRHPRPMRSSGQQGPCRGASPPKLPLGPPSCPFDLMKVGLSSSFGPNGRSGSCST